MATLSNNSDSNGKEDEVHYLTDRDIQSQDILLVGRCWSKRHRMHVGSVAFRTFITSQVPHYVAATNSRANTIRIVALCANSIAESGSRILRMVVVDKRDGESCTRKRDAPYYWKEVDKRQWHKLVGEALRDRIRMAKRSKTPETLTLPAMSRTRSTNTLSFTEIFRATVEDMKSGVSSGTTRSPLATRGKADTRNISRTVSDDTEIRDLQEHVGSSDEKEQDPQLVHNDDIRSQDILLGSVLQARQHVGSRAFRAFVRSKSKSYNDANKSGLDRRSIIVALATDSLLQTDTRMLQKVKDLKNYWVPVDRKDWALKMGYMIRYHAGQFRKHSVAIPRYANHKYVTEISSFAKALQDEMVAQDDALEDKAVVQTDRVDEDTKKPAANTEAEPSLFAGLIDKQAQAPEPYSSNPVEDDLAHDASAEPLVPSPASIYTSRGLHMPQLDIYIAPKVPSQQAAPQQETDLLLSRENAQLTDASLLSLLTIHQEALRRSQQLQEQAHRQSDIAAAAFRQLASRPGGEYTYSTTFLNASSHAQV